ncbi:ABC transporter transmembrane domain-containing protein [Lactobacillus sp. R2/2]|nr:ABC transporter transmembrane domain-containing protein [Lactobacillus sp. R2/2]
MKYLFKYVRQEPLRVLLVVILQVICSLFRVANSIFNIFILNSLVKFDFRAFVSYILLNILLFVVMTVFLFLNLVEQAKVIQLLSLHVKQDIISHISKYSVEKFNEYDTSVYSSWLTNDMNLIEGNGFGNLFQSIQIITDPLFSIIALIKFHWTFVPLILLMTVLTIFLPQLVRKQLATSNLSMTKANANVLDIINDCLRGFSTLSVLV